MQIDVSDDENLRIVADGVSVSPVKEVRDFRKVALQRLQVRPASFYESANPINSVQIQNNISTSNEILEVVC